MIRRTRSDSEAAESKASAEARAAHAEQRASEAEAAKRQAETEAQQAFALAEAAKRQAEAEVAEAISWAEETLRRTSETAESPAPPTGDAAAREAMIDSVHEGKPLSVRALAQQFALTRYAATALRRDVLAGLEASPGESDVSPA